MKLRYKRIDHSRHMLSHSVRQYPLLPTYTSSDSVQDANSLSWESNVEHTVNDELKPIPSL